MNGWPERSRSLPETEESDMVQATAETTLAGTESLLETFERLIEPTAGRHPAWLFPLRKAALARFAEVGYPTTADEDWRFTNVAPVTKLPFRPVLEPREAEVELPVDLAFGGLETIRLVFVNGHYSARLSRIGLLPAHVKVCSLAEALVSDSDLLERHLAQYSQGAENPFALLNAAFFQDGAWIYVPRGTTVGTPIHLVFLTNAREAGATILPRTLVVAEAGSRVTLLESHVGLMDGRTVTNAVTECVVEEEAVVEHLKLQDERPRSYHFSSLHARLGRACNYVAHSIALGAMLSRNDIRATLAGEGLECVLNGLYLTRGDQLADHHMVVEHAQPHCASHEYFNGILDDQSKGVFHGRILVRPIAQKTDAKQTNKNLLLSEQATANTKPQLEIYADDVKCTHGATVGQMNEESIFYLRSRGIGLATARRMLMHSFAGEIVDRVRCEPAREELDRLVWGRLEQNPHIASQG
jgi:Fe-S cluster assembly protein SufD